MSTSDIKLLRSLVNYVLDVKPYHTKLRDFTSELFFSDRFNVLADDVLSTNICLQDIWTRDSAGGYKLFNVSSGIETDRFMRIPAAVWPRFSLDDRPWVQRPRGDDPAISEYGDENHNTFPDTSYPWTGPTSSSHFEVDTTFPADFLLPVQALITSRNVTIISVGESSGTYTLNFDVDLTIDTTFESVYGFGSALKVEISGTDYSGTAIKIGNVVTIDNVVAVVTPSTDVLDALPIGTTTTEIGTRLAEQYVNATIYWLDTGRYAVPFHQGSRIYVDLVAQLFGVDYVVDTDRTWIQFLVGRHPPAGARIDAQLMKVDKIYFSYISPFDYDAGYDGFDMLPYDLNPYDSGIDPDYFEVTINDAAPGRIGSVTFNTLNPGTKGELENLTIGASAIDGEVWRISAVGPWLLSVARYSPTPTTPETVAIRTPFDNGALAFTVVPPWSNYYMVPDYNTYNTLDVTVEGLDPTDYLCNIALQTQHAALDDPNIPYHQPVEFVNVGKVYLQAEDSGLEYYVFVFNEIPPVGTYVELRVDQNGQYNPWFNAVFSEDLNISVVTSPTPGPAPSPTPSPSPSPSPTPTPTPTPYYLYVSSETIEYNARTAFEAEYFTPFDPVDVVVYVNALVRSGDGPDLGVAAFDTGTWPYGTTFTIVNYSDIQGRGGYGGAGGTGVSNGGNGTRGRDALNIQLDVTIDNTTGFIFGGGGGGGGGAYGSGGGWGGGGGGGQGAPSSIGGAAGGVGAGNGVDGNNAVPGTGGVGAPGFIIPGGAGNRGGFWGEAGLAGSLNGAGTGLAGSGGPAGRAIKKNGWNVTFTGGNNSSQVKGPVA